MQLQKQPRADAARAQHIFSSHQCHSHRPGEAPLKAHTTAHRPKSATAACCDVNPTGTTAAYHTNGPTDAQPPNQHQKPHGATTGGLNTINDADITTPESIPMTKSQTAIATAVAVARSQAPTAANPLSQQHPRAINNTDGPIGCFESIHPIMNTSSYFHCP